MLRFCLCILLIAGCSGGPEIAGTSEQGNAFVAGYVLAPDGSPAAGAAVTLRSHDFLDDAVPALLKAARQKAETVTEADGRFSIDGLDSGAYAIEIRDNGGHALLLRCELETSEANIDLGANTLLPTADITGTVDSALAAQYALTVQVYGLEHHAAVGPDGKFTLHGMPAGTLSLRIASADTGFSPIVIDSVKAASGETSLLPYASWPHSQKIYINTGATGADVGEDIYDFPLLVRLTSSVFDFSGASGTGEDVRFSRPDGTPLPFEVEKWDSLGTDAALWVRMDTVLGNDSSQFIVLWSGNPSAGPAWSSPDVFDSATGYRAVWHFDEELAGTGAAGLYRDASENAFHGDDFISSVKQSGVVGYGHGFDGVDDYIHVAAAVVEMGRADFTLELWAQGDSGGGCLFYLGDSLSVWSGGGQMFYLGGGIADSLAGGLFPSLAGFGNGVAVTEDPIPFSEYDHYVFRWEYIGGDSGTVSIFRNCVPMPLAADTYRAPAAGGSTGNVWIGAGPGLAGGGYLSGSIDELRVSQTARSDAWIQLCYHNQRRAITILRFD